MNRETAPILRTPNRRRCRHVHNMPDVLAQMRRSGRVHFVKALPKSALPNPRVKQTAKFSLPQQFVKEDSDKIEELVTLRVQTSTGRSSTSWRVHICVTATLIVQLVGGWPAFVTDNRLKTGDFAMFVLREDAGSEFEVHLFRGPNASPYFPDKGERQSEQDEEEEESGSSDSEFEEEKTSNQPHIAAAPVYQQDEHFSRNYTRELNPGPFQLTGNPCVPRFSKRLVASNIGRPTGNFKPGQFKFPVHFIRNHGERVHGPVKLQGIHENSRNYVITCHRRPRNLASVYFTPTEWSRFVRDNDLKEGQELQFSLMANSHFVVRKISESQTCQCGLTTPATSHLS